MEHVEGGHANVGGEAGKAAGRNPGRKCKHKLHVATCGFAVGHGGGGGYQRQWQ